MAAVSLVKLYSNECQWTLLMINQHRCRQATSHYLSQWWPRSVSSLGLNELTTTPARPPCEPPTILSHTQELRWTPLSCGMVGCCQVNSNLANIDLKNSIQILKWYPLWNAHNLFGLQRFYHYKNYKVVLISYSLSKAASKAAENNGLITLTSPHPVPSWQYPGGSGLLSKQMMATTENSSYRG